MTMRRGPGAKPGVGRTYEDNEKLEGCFTYFFTGRVGHCVMLPVWRWIGKNILRLE